MSTCIVHKFSEEDGRQRRLLGRFQHACAARKQRRDHLKSDLLHAIGHSKSVAKQTLKTWFMGQFHGVMRPATPIGSIAMRSFGACWPSRRTHSIPSNAFKKFLVCQGKHAAWLPRAKSMGAPISVLIACAISSALGSVLLGVQDFLY